MDYTQLCNYNIWICYLTTRVETQFKSEVWSLRHKGDFKGWKNRQGTGTCIPQLDKKSSKTTLHITMYKERRDYIFLILIKAHEVKDNDNILIP